MKSITVSTERQYNSTLKLWWEFCGKKGYSVFNSGVKEVIEFLELQLQSKSYKYGTFNSFRSALALILPDGIGTHPLIKRYLKALSNIRPSAPRYKNTWNTQPLLDHLQQLYPNEKLTLKNMSIKLVTLLTLITGQRLQTISLIKLENIKKLDIGFHIYITDRIKTSGINKFQPCLQVPFFLENPALCVAKLLECYIEKTKTLRNQINELFITSRPSYKPASKQTLSRWIKTGLELAGIDPKFKPHSTRHASTSKAFSNGVSVDLICQTAGWTQSSTFAKWYNKPVVDTTKFANVNLQS